MRTFFVMFAAAVLLLFTSSAGAIGPQAAAPQTARQALIEMFFGDAPNHLEKHLPDVTRKAVQQAEEGGSGPGVLQAFSGLVSQAKDGKEKIETFDTGSTLVAAKNIPGGTYDKAEITVERDDFSGDEDTIEVAFHLTRAGKEETLPFIPRFTFTMKMESEVWRLMEISVGIRLPLADPDFLKSLLERQRTENEQMALYAMRSVITAETSYQSDNNTYACTLEALGKHGATSKPAHRSYLYDTQLISGKKNGYVFAIANCDATHYQFAAEPGLAGSGQRAFCTDESGTIRSSSDGKAPTCLSSGTVVENSSGTKSASGAPQSPTYTLQGNSNQGNSNQSGVSAGRIRISQGVASGLVSSKVPPDYPPVAREARVQGAVVLKALISRGGEVENLQLISGHPLLAPAAIAAVKQWKYRPYLLNGTAVAVETQVQVNFTLNDN